MPVAEIVIFVEAGSHWGLWSTIGAIFTTAIVGSFLIRYQGIAVLSKIRHEMNSGYFPAYRVFDGLFLLIAGALLLTPGFITDAAGFILLIPVARHLVIARVISHVKLHYFNRGDCGRSQSGQTINGEFTDTTGRSPSKRKSDLQLPTSR